MKATCPGRDSVGTRVCDIPQDPFVLRIFDRKGVRAREDSKSLSARRPSADMSIRRFARDGDGGVMGVIPWTRGDLK